MSDYNPLNCGYKTVCMNIKLIKLVISINLNYSFPKENLFLYTWWGNCRKIRKARENVAGLNYNIMHVSKLFLHLICLSMIP